MSFANQQFDDFEQWVNHASSWLTSHPQYRSTEHRKRGDPMGWQGEHFTAICFDALGRQCRIGADFQKARDENAFPIRWVWPDQVGAAIISVIYSGVPVPPWTAKGSIS